MRLWLVRHAHAEERSPGEGDAERELTKRGRRLFQGVVATLEARGERFERILTSPLVRARQTADLLAPLSESPPRDEPGLAAAPSAALCTRLAGERLGCKRLALVGHEPWMSGLLALLVLGDPDQGERFRFAKGGLARLEGDPRPGGMQLRALVPPKLLRD